MQGGQTYHDIRELRLGYVGEIDLLDRHCCCCVEIQSSPNGSKGPLADAVSQQLQDRDGTIKKLARHTARSL